MNTEIQTRQTAVTKFNASSARTEVLKQMDQMLTHKLISLPNDFKESVYFAMEKLTALNEIEKVESTSITKTLIDVLSSGLDIRKNHLYFFVQNDKNSRTGKSLRYGWQYQGKIYKVKKELGVIDVYPVLIHENDTVKKRFVMGSLVIEEHIPTFEGSIIGGYCVVDFGDRYLVKYYSKEELDKRRKASKASEGSFWKWEREMYEKTLINATLTRLLETSSGIDNDSLYADETETVNYRDVIDTEIVEQGEPTETATPSQPYDEDVEYAEVEHVEQTFKV